MADDKPIIVVKKKGGHGGHHGGAWKVAYADFVTAMMAFFMVMWLVNSASAPTKQNIASYFRKPGIFHEGSGTPLQIGGSGILPDAAPPLPEEKKERSEAGQSMLKKKSGSDDDTIVKKVTVRGQKDKGQGNEETTTEKTLVETPDELTVQGKIQIQSAAEQIKKEIAESKEFQELIGMVDVRMDADGLNIDIMDTDKSSMFRSGSASLLPEAETAFQKLSSILSKIPNSIEIVGHTDATPFSKRPDGYSNWELSADRANAARRLLVGSGIPTDRIISVIGRADKELKFPKTPGAASNRRITLKMRFKILPPIEQPDDEYAVDRFRSIENKFQEQQRERERLEAKAKEPVHEITPEEILDPSKREVQKTIPLPDKSPRSDGDAAPPRKYPNLIFNDNPVIGPADRIANF